MGPLEGKRIIELAGIGPGPFAAMVLADYGAEVIRVDRSGAVADEFPTDRPLDLSLRGRRSIGVDLKSAAGIETVLRMVESADAILEGFRPGVAERLGLGPDVCLARNPKIIFGRMTGWGQYGSYASTAGHDINYIALSGALDKCGRFGERPTPPANLLGDFGGGGMLLALGVCAALVETASSGQGQVIDAAMTDGSALLGTLLDAMDEMGQWGPRGTNLIDTGAFFYDVYECSDGEFITIGSIEPQFYAQLLEILGIDPGDMPRQNDRSKWPELKVRFVEIFKTKSRAEWEALMEGTDVCFAPVLNRAEAIAHPHNVERKTFVEVAGITQPAPAPRFSRTPAEIPRPPSHAGEHTDEVLTDWGFGADELAELREAGAIK